MNYGNPEWQFKELLPTSPCGLGELKRKKKEVV